MFLFALVFPSICVNDVTLPRNCVTSQQEIPALLHRENSFTIKSIKMKYLVLLIILAAFITQAQAQKVNAKDVPAPVTNAFKVSHPTQKDIDWSKDGKNYEAEFDMNKEDVSITYDASGKLLDTEVEMEASALPASIQTYVENNYKEHEIREASKTTDFSGVLTYEAQVQGMDLIFDANGNFLRSVKK